MQEKMRTIRTIYPEIIFYVNCKDSEVIKATNLANSIANKLKAKDPNYKPKATSRFINIKLMEQYDAAL